MEETASVILFFRTSGSPTAARLQEVKPEVPLSFEIWKPKWNECKPNSFGTMPWVLWWFFHWFRLFRNRSYRLFLVHDGRRLVHRSCVFPPYFRFPFMLPADVQVGDIWTDNSQRGRGLAKAVLKRIIADFSGRNVWFLCESTNRASARLAQSAGMTLIGTGKRRSKWGVSLFGRFELDV